MDLYPNHELPDRNLMEYKALNTLKLIQQDSLKTYMDRFTAPISFRSYLTTQCN